MIVSCFRGSQSQPTTIAKIAATRDQEFRHFREATNLAHLGKSARNAGVRVPRLVTLERTGNRLGLNETALKGQLFTVLLAKEPKRLPQLMEQVTTWLVRWNLSTRVVKPLLWDE